MRDAIADEKLPPLKVFRYRGIVGRGQRALTSLTERGSMELERLGITEEELVGDTCS